MQEHGDYITPERIHHELKKIHCLRICKQTAAAQNSIACEKSADGGKRQVSVLTDIFVLTHFIASNRTALSITLRQANSRPKIVKFQIILIAFALSVKIPQR